MSQHHILYALEDRPSFMISLTAAVQHVLASFIGVVTPTLIIASALGLQAEVPYLVSMALLVTGIGTFIQTRGFGPVGSGLVAIQGTSFAFISALLMVGTTIKARGGSNDDILAMMLGVCFWGAFVEIILSQFIQQIKRVITPITTGVVIIAIGISLIKVGMTDLAGGFNSDSFGSVTNLSLGLGVLLVIIYFNAHKNRWLRLSAIFIGMFVGTIMAWFAGITDFSNLTSLPLFSFPQPFKYGFHFDWALFLPIALIYFFTAIETAGDLTANSLFCQLPIKGDKYLKRIRAGILGDGINSLLAAVFCTFPNTTFGQNNGVIQMTGIASRKVGYFVAAVFVVLGVFPFIGAILQAIPKPVLGGATLVMFSMVAVGGVKILTCEPLNQRNSLITACSLGMGLGVMMVGNLLSQLPPWLGNIFVSPVTTAGLTAIVLSLVLPDAEQPQIPAESLEATK
ncbi:uracil-xanthine permease family protein [Alteromonas lipolytica]|uniref:Xanthine permease XanP n=1 Tax=Alteromonas lipolytica TaxID=1856405 RepID=A0A1E8FKA7_9ALTE|nr:nucleobase:cation symporter-2 family protein [Alteromonas lipolytica]OFI36381.1 xanthine permease XanP [Alteromonas lipolytica]GGF70367.1 xanthine permease [Alteromonas lipolytica]